MREIKFRKWDFEVEEMIPGDALAFEHYAPLAELLSVEGVMQYTGLKDKNGVEIYEGDILDYGKRSDYTLRFEVVFDHSGFSRKWISKETAKIRGLKIENLAYNTGSIFEVIGNIYEHPHLLEETK